jgi:hypothetical protein
MADVLASDCRIFGKIFGEMAFEGRFRRKQKGENNREFTGDWIGRPGWT